jgi:hypothetical protein
MSNRNFNPIRVKRQDAEKQPQKNMSVKIFNRGARHYLHPSLAILDKINCELAYYNDYRVMVVSYDTVVERVDNTDYMRRRWSHEVMSHDVNYIVEWAHEYLDSINKQKHRMNNINSLDSQSNNTMEEA